MSLSRARLAGQYIFWEILPSFILGNVVFIFILLMFQVLRLSEFIINHGVPLAVIGQIMSFLTISFLPACIPLSLLFSVLLTYGRLSGDSEIVAFKAIGLHIGHLVVPAVVLSFLVAVLSAYISFFAAPWGNRGFEVLINKVDSTKAASQIQGGTFAEGYFDLVLYADKVDSKHGLLKKVFIYDERDSKSPLTIIAQEGRLVDADPRNPGRGITLRLVSGNIHRSGEKNYTKVDFQTYDISLANTAAVSTAEKSPPSWTYDDLRTEMDVENPIRANILVAQAEFHKRFALAAACLVFGVLGVGAGTFTNRRGGRSSGLVISLVIMVSYWVLYITGDSLTRSGALPAWFAMWIPNYIFGAVGIWSLKRSI